jgi:hypothetical protein
MKSPWVKIDPSVLNTPPPRSAVEHLLQPGPLTWEEIFHAKPRLEASSALDAPSLEDLSSENDNKLNGSKEQ